MSFFKHLRQGRKKISLKEESRTSCFSRELNPWTLNKVTRAEGRKALFAVDFETAEAALDQLQEEGKAILYMALISPAKPLHLSPEVLCNIIGMLIRSDGEEFFRWILKDYHEIRVPKVVLAAVEVCGLFPCPGSRQLLFKVITDPYTSFRLQAIRQLAVCGNSDDITRLKRLTRYFKNYKKAITATIKAIKKRLRAQSAGWLSPADEGQGNLSLNREDG